MSRFKLGAALGGAAVYFFDPLQGEDRRRRVQSLWRDNHDAVLEVGGGASWAAGSMRPLVRRMKRRLEHGDWTEDAGAPWVPALMGIAVATALGGALVYFLDQENGLLRRRRVLTFLGGENGAVNGGFRSVQRGAETLIPRTKQAAGEASEAAENMRAAGRG